MTTGFDYLYRGAQQSGISEYEDATDALVDGLAYLAKEVREDGGLPPENGIMHVKVSTVRLLLGAYEALAD